MTTFRSDFLQVLSARGFIHQGTDLAALDEAAAKGSITGYNGFDATADSLHVGHLLPIMMLRWMKKTGHTPIILMGGGTTKVGDPSGRDESRQLLTNEAIDANIQSIQRIFTQLGFFEGEKPAILVNNADWLDEIKYVPFLRDIGRHFSVNRMLGFDSVKLRLEREQPLSFLEFNYMILQAYDFVELFRRFGCTLQTGGSDQWGNIVNGVELGRRVVQAELFGLTCPLLTTSSGAKMGKTAAGAVWLNADRLSAYDYYQYWRNTEDADVGRFLKLFTELPLDEIARLEALEGAEINEAKKVLAFEATTLAHGEAAAKAAAETARQTFEQGAASEGLPTFVVSLAEASAQTTTTIVRISSLASSNTEARKLIAAGAIRIDDKPITDPNQPIRLNADAPLKVTKGKKHHALVKLSDE